MTLSNPRLVSAPSVTRMEGESVTFETPAELIIGDESRGVGKICVTNNRIVFMDSDLSSTSFGFRAMVMHAVTSENDKRFIFIQLLTDAQDEEFEAEESQDQQDIVKIVPVDQSQVSPLFEAMNEASALNPDSGMEESEYEGEMDGEQ